MRIRVRETESVSKRRCGRWVAIGATVMLAALAGARPADAAACRDIKSVQDSADPSKNTAMGGHLLQHIDGETPPPGTSQEGKTLYENRGKFQQVWKAYTKNTKITPINCSGSQAQQQVPLSTLGITNLGAQSCKAADGRGRCTQYDAYIAKEVFFGFILKDGTWILNTSFPIPDA